MKNDQGNGRAENLLLPLALFGFLAPIVTFLIAIASIASEIKIAVLSILVGGYTLLFVLSYQRFGRQEGARAYRNDIRDSDLPAPVTSKGDQVFTDRPTGLPNLAAFQLVLEHELAESLRNPDDRPLSILAVEIDGVSKVNGNDDRVHDKPVDTVVIGRLKTCLRAMDFAALSGDRELLVLLPAANESAAAEIAHRIEVAFSSSGAELEASEKTVFRPHIGIATFSSSEETADSLLRSAISKMREAKARSTTQKMDDSGGYLN